MRGTDVVTFGMGNLPGPDDTCLPGFAIFSATPPGNCALAWRGPAAIRIPAMNETIKPGPEIPLQAIGLPHLSVVVPTFNERDNVTTLYKRLEATFGTTPWEVVFVDDNSPDGTWEVVRDLARRDPRVRCIRR